MFLASKAAWAGIVFILLTTGVSGPRPTLLPLGATLSKEVPAVGDRNDVKKMQQTLRGNGHYRGEVDGVFGLRTRASIRGFQKAENLPVTGQLDTQTAVNSESDQRDATRGTTRLRKVNLLQAKNGLKVRGEQAGHYGTQSRQLQLLKAAGEPARRHFKLRTTTTHSSLSSFQWSDQTERCRISLLKIAGLSATCVRLPWSE
jgi:peptidoglycan hydrolase-like protein with peptidoglycan-binding domain